MPMIEGTFLPQYEQVEPSVQRASVGTSVQSPSTSTYQPGKGWTSGGGWSEQQERLYGPLSDKQLQLQMYKEKYGKPQTPGPGPYEQGGKYYHVPTYEQTEPGLTPITAPTASGIGPTNPPGAVVPLRGRTLPPSPLPWERPANERYPALFRYMARFAPPTTQRRVDENEWWKKFYV